MPINKATSVIGLLNLGSEVLKVAGFTALHGPTCRRQVHMLALQTGGGGGSFVVACSRTEHAWG